MIAWVYAADAYLALVLALCGGVMFAIRIAPGLIPALVGWVARAPFLLGLLIPIWAGATPCCTATSPVSCRGNQPGGVPDRASW